MTTKRPRMPNGIYRDADRETRPVNGQRHEPGNGSRSGNAGTDEAAAAARPGSCSNPRKPASCFGVIFAATGKRVGDARLRSGMPHMEGYFRGLLDEQGRLGLPPPQADQETAVEPVEAPGGGAAGMEAPPEPPPDEAHEPWEAAMNATAELKAVLLTFKADFVRWARNERRGRRRRAGLMMAAGFPACLLLGLLIQVQFEVIPPHDPTSGWGKHVQDTYGRTIGNCEIEAMLTKSEVDCLLTVGRP